MGREAVGCPGCGYDLYGLRDGACPECGRVFTWVELHAVRERGRQWSRRDRRVALFGWAMGIWTTIALGLLGMGGLDFAWGRCPADIIPWNFDIFMNVLGVMWVMTALWSVHWLHDRPSRPLVLLWVWIPTLRTLLLLASLWTADHRALLAAEVLLGFAILLWPFWCQPLKSAWITGVLFAAIALLIGTAYLLTGLAGAAAGELWSGWEDFRPGQKYDQYPLTNREAVRFGIVLASLGVGVGIGLAVAYRRVWSVRGACGAG